MNKLEAQLRRSMREIGRDLVMEKAYNDLKKEVGTDEAKIGEFATLCNDAYKVVKEFFQSRGIDRGKGLVVLDSIIITVANAALDESLEDIQVPAPADN